MNWSSPSLWPKFLTVRTRLARGVICHPRTLVNSAGRDLVAGGRSGEGEQTVLAGPRVCPRLSGRASYVPGTYGGDVKQSILAQRTGVWKRAGVTRQAVISRKAEAGRKGGQKLRSPASELGWKAATQVGGMGFPRQ